MIEKRKPETDEHKDKRKRDRNLNDIRVITSTPEGRRFYWRLLSEGKIFQDGYIPNDAGYGTTYFSGKRSVGIWALNELMLSKPDMFMQMQRENASEAKREELDDKDRQENKDILKPDN